tara:strand:+ start:216 stop:2075 length:1860 start_codon:yes stop_codon:yes gene_type:complete
MKVVFYILFFCCVIPFLSQENNNLIVFYGAIKNSKGKGISSVSVGLYENDTLLEKVLTNKKGKCKLSPFTYGHVYKIKFDKKGFYSKHIEIDLVKNYNSIKSSIEAKAFLEPSITLIKNEGGSDQRISKEIGAIAKAYINPNNGKLDWDYNYNKKTREEVEEFIELWEVIEKNEVLKKQFEIYTQKIKAAEDKLVKAELENEIRKKELESKKEKDSLLEEQNEYLFSYLESELELANKENELKEKVLLKNKTLLMKKELNNLKKAKKIEELNNEKKIQDFILKNSQLEIKQKDALAIKKERELFLLNKEKTLTEENLQKQKNIRNLILSGFGLLIIFLTYVFFSLKKSRKSNAIISKQKDDINKSHLELQQKHKEISDSINYAKTIQTAILPQTKIIKEYLENSFILYKPKDIVAGDFYWMEHFEGKTLFAAADCTGHGVPGAMVSVICNNALNRSVREFRLTNPGEILNNTKKLVIQEFEKSEKDVHDGMDIALCCLEGNRLSYSGANNPLWIIRKNEIIEYKADKQPIGNYRLKKPFSTHEITLEKEDVFYLLSDGYADQFGGEKGKKYKTINLKNFLLCIHREPMVKQKKLLEKEFESWKGEYDQIDDVCIIGVKI